MFKQAFAELLQERRDLLYDVFIEVLEDIALANAIKEGEETEVRLQKAGRQNLGRMKAGFTALRRNIIFLFEKVFNHESEI